MPRLFVTPREIDFFNDIAKELIKDVNGQKIYYYPISYVKSKVDAIYEESLEKVFENPIEINCMVEWQQAETKTTRWGQETIRNIKVYVQSRDMIQKEIKIKDGDFFSYGSEFFEITSVTTYKNMFGQVEYDSGIEVLGRQAREGQFSAKPLGPTSEAHADPDAVQQTFVQQRGFEENAEGPTGDKRDLVEKGVLEKPLPEKPAEVSSKGTTKRIGPAFYGEDI